MKEKLITKATEPEVWPGLAPVFEPAPHQTTGDLTRSCNKKPDEIVSTQNERCASELKSLFDRLASETEVPQDVWAEVYAKFAARYKKVTAAQIAPPHIMFNIYAEAITCSGTNAEKAERAGVNERSFKDRKSVLNSLLVETLEQNGQKLPVPLRKLIAVKPANANPVQKPVPAYTKAEIGEPNASSENPAINTEALSQVLQHEHTQADLKQLPHALEMFVCFAAYRTIQPFLEAHQVSFIQSDIPSYDTAVKRYLTAGNEPCGYVHTLLKRVLFNHWVEQKTHWGSDNKDLAKLNLEQGIGNAVSPDIRAGYTGEERRFAANVTNFLSLMLGRDVTVLSLSPNNRRFRALIQEHNGINGGDIHRLNDIALRRVLQRMVVVQDEVPRSLDVYMSALASGLVPSSELARQLSETLGFSANYVMACMEAGDQFLMNIITHSKGIDMDWKDLCFDQKYQLIKARNTIRAQYHLFAS